MILPQLSTTGGILLISARDPAKTPTCLQSLQIQPIGFSIAISLLSSLLVHCQRALCSFPPRAPFLPGDSLYWWLLLFRPSIALLFLPLFHSIAYRPVVTYRSYLSDHPARRHKPVGVIRAKCSRILQVPRPRCFRIHASTVAPGL